MRILFLSIFFIVTMGKPIHFTFNDVTYPDATTGEIEASSKTGNEYTTCRYFSDDYIDYLGRYDSDEFGSADGGEVLQFCLDNYDNRE